MRFLRVFKNLKSKNCTFSGYQPENVQSGAKYIVINIISFSENSLAIGPKTYKRTSITPSQLPTQKHPT
jgi:hypothetical protein